MQTVVVANGIIENEDRALSAAGSADLLIAANGGTRHCLRLGLMPAVVVGDLDSLETADRQVVSASGTELLPYPIDKDQTDLEIALLLAAERGADEIVVLGAIGGRLDMTVANVLLLTHPKLHGLHVELWHANETAYVLEAPGGKIEGQPGDLISLIPLGSSVSEITTKGLRYPLDREALVSGPARGVSNELITAEANVNFGSGALLVTHTPSSPGRGGAE